MHVVSNVCTQIETPVSVPTIYHLMFYDSIFFQGGVLIFTLSRQPSFNALKFWLEEIRAVNIFYSYD